MQRRWNTHKCTRKRWTYMSCLSITLTRHCIWQRGYSLNNPFNPPICGGLTTTDVQLRSIYYRAWQVTLIRILSYWLSRGPEFRIGREERLMLLMLIVGFRQSARARRTGSKFFAIWHADSEFSTEYFFFLSVRYPRPMVIICSRGILIPW